MGYYEEKYALMTDVDLFTQEDDFNNYLTQGYDFAKKVNNQYSLQATLTQRQEKKMAIKNKKAKKSTTKLPTLIQCGRHLINPRDVRCITKVRNDLYIVKFLSDPSPEYPCWVERKYIGNLLEHFNILSDDSIQDELSEITPDRF